jgi:hypothetical protein
MIELRISEWQSLRVILKEPRRLKDLGSPFEQVDNEQGMNPDSSSRAIKIFGWPFGMT